MSPAASVHAVNRWASGIIPAILAGCIGLATYVVSKRICVDYFLHDRGRRGAAITLLALLFVLVAFVISTYTRLLCAIVFNPGVLPKEHTAVPAKESRQLDKAPNQHDLEAQNLDSIRDNDPNSPGLERFYSKDVFVCENDGLPRWCSSCRTWKPDRVHHSSEIDRCVKKMDHYCPWVGSIISETSFKFFVQFVSYTAAYCIVCLVACVLCLRDQKATIQPLDGFVIAITALSAFFGLFTFGMSILSLRYIFLNLTNVEDLRQKSTVHQLAIRVPLNIEPGPRYNLITYPLPEPALSPRSQSSSSGGEGRSAQRDSLANRKFAVVKTQVGENPWDLGPYRNWVSVMGTNVFDWLLPIRHSPCVSSEDNNSFYAMGHLYNELRTRYSLPPLSDDGRQTTTEMQEVGRAAGR